MSAQIVIHCNTLGEYSQCSSQVIVTDATTVAQARAAARRVGWRTTRDGRDHCPPSSPPMIFIRATREDGDDA